MKATLENLAIGFSPTEPFDDFIVGKYKFRYTGKRSQEAVTIYSSDCSLREARHNHKNAEVEFEGENEPTILFKRDGVTGRRGQGPENSNERTFLEDLMVIGSILNGWNWQLASIESYADYWPIGKNGLKDICEFSSHVCANYIEKAVKKITDENWQRQFENGFHLVMFRNHARIHTLEPQFLSNCIIWEWLYPHIKNPNGASFDDESDNLREIIAGVLNHFWKDKVNTNIFNRKSHTIFDVLRNQIAHSGRLPIDRPYAEDWMKSLSWEEDVKKYLKFFNSLTQVVVLKTLGIDSEANVFKFHHPCGVDYILSHGRFPDIEMEKL